MHLGTGHRRGQINIYDDFKEDERFAQLLRAKTRGEDEVHLVFNGDIFDLLKVPVLGTFSETIDERLAKIKLYRCLRGHPVFVKAIAKFLENENAVVHFQPGNHDMEFFFTGVQRVFCRALTGEDEHPRVRFHATEPFWELDGVQFHHGQQFEAIHAMDFSRLFIERANREPVLNLPWGSLFVLNVVNVTLLAVPIVVLVATSQSVVRARTTGLLEFLLSQPARRSDWFNGLVMSRALALLLPLALMMLAAFGYGLISEGDALALGGDLLRSFSIVVSLVCAFLGIGLWISVTAPSEEKALLWALSAWLLATALHDFALIGVLLRTNLPPEAVFALAAINPVEAARVALLSSLDAQLSILGPVGFWIANKLGAQAAFAIGVAWPLCVGLLFTWRAKRRFERRDLIA